MSQLRRTRRQWIRVGRSDPLWGVLSDRSKKGNRWDPDEFLQTGDVEIAEVLGRLKSMDLVPSPPVLDVGCGAGRLTQALASAVGRSVGVDISEGMVDKANELNRLGGECEFKVIDGSGLADFADASFGMVYSALVLQHMPSRTAQRYIADFCRVLRPGGIAVFQVPIGKAPGAKALRIRASLAVRRPWRRMDIHCVGQEQVLSLLAAGGCGVREMTADWRAGGGWRSMTFYAVKHP